MVLIKFLGGNQQVYLYVNQKYNIEDQNQIKQASTKLEENYIINKITQIGVLGDVHIILPNRNVWIL